MKTKLTLIITILVLLTSGAWAQENPLLRRLQLSDQQLDDLSTLLQEYDQKQAGLESQLAAKAVTLGMELLRPGRLADAEAAGVSAERTNKLVREYTKLYGQAFRTRVEYMLKAKDLLTDAQKIILIHSLDFDLDPFENLGAYDELEWLDLGLDLKASQIKKILTLRTERLVQELKIDLKIDLLLVDLGVLLLSDERDTGEVNKIMLSLTDLATQHLDNLTTQFLKTKDVLTLEQKREVFLALMLAP